MTITTIPYDKWLAMMNDPTLPGAKDVGGISPGGAAAELGISRQAVMHAIKVGRLHATRVPVPQPINPNGCMWLISEDALKAFRKLRRKHSA